MLKTLVHPESKREIKVSEADEASYRARGYLSPEEVSDDLGDPTDDETGDDETGDDQEDVETFED